MRERLRETRADDARGAIQTCLAAILGVVVTSTRSLVTGGAGFIGSHLVRRLLQDGHDVRVIDDLSTGHEANLAGLAGLDVRRCDLATAALEPHVKGRDIIFHLAAIPSVPRSVVYPRASHEAAATATLRLLLAARDAGISRFVTSSSSSVYGNVSAPPMRESMQTLPRSPYGVAKLAAEGYTRVCAELYGMSTVTLRYFNVFGPRQDPSSEYAAVIPRFIGKYLRGDQPEVYGDGLQLRDFTYVDNVIDANLAAVRARHLSGESVNIAAGAPHSVLDLLKTIADIFGFWIEPIFKPPRPGDIRDSHADISLARRLLGYEPRVAFEDGLRMTVQALREVYTAPA